MKNNQGVTLVELIVVILIIGVLSGGAMYGVKSIDSGNAQASVERISALLDYVRAENMSKDKVYFLVLEENNDQYTVKVESGEGGTRTNLLNEKLKLKDGTITYINDLNTSQTIDSSVTPAVKLELKFDKETGGFSIGSDGHYIKSIVIYSSGRSYTIQLVTITGKHYIE